MVQRLTKVLVFVSVAVVLLSTGARCANAAEIETTVRHKTEAKYVCVDLSLDRVVGANDRRTTARNDCIEKSADAPARNLELRWTEVIRSEVVEDLREWVVAPYWRSDDRPLYDCSGTCPANKNRGANIGRSMVEAVGRCEGPLSPVWGSTSKQWQYHTNDDGVRGLTYCALMIPEGAPVDPPPPPPPPPQLTLTYSAEDCGLWVRWTMPTTYANGGPIDYSTVEVTPRFYLGDYDPIDARPNSTQACLKDYVPGTYELRMSSVGPGGDEGVKSNSLTVAVE